MPFPANAFETSGRQSITFRDAKGYTSRFSVYYDFTGVVHIEDALTDISDLIAATAALSNAHVTALNGSVTEWGTVQYGAHASGGAYESVIEGVTMVFQDSFGTLHRYVVPAPKISIFLADKITVDPANALVTTFVAKMKGPGTLGSAGVFSRQEIHLTDFMGGQYRARRLRHRKGLLQLDGDLTPTEPE